MASDSQLHAAQQERQGERLRNLRSRKRELVESGVTGWELMEAMTTLTLSLKEEEKLRRPRGGHICSRCWHDREKRRCICSKITRLLEGTNRAEPSGHQCSTSEEFNVKLLILMHSKEYLNPGNSARLLRLILPEDSSDGVRLLEYYIFGKEGDVDRLLGEVMEDPESAMILWPGGDSLSVADFLEKWRERIRQQTPSHRTVLDRDAGEGATAALPLIRSVVLDGTYTQARNMYGSLRKRSLLAYADRRLPAPVQLRPTSESVFRRAQKNYGRAHQQNQQLGTEKKGHDEEDDCNDECDVGEGSEGAPARRISTAEACGLLLSELGGGGHRKDALQETIAKAILINNEALFPQKGHAKREMDERNGTVEETERSTPPVPK